MELIFIGIGLAVFFVFTLWYFSLPTVKGKIGERKVKKIITKLSKDQKGIHLHDIMLGVGDKSCQIDHIFITKKSAYIIETKNYRGRIYGNENDQHWYQTIKYRNKVQGKRSSYYKTHIEKTPFYNPINQNQTHIRRMLSHIPDIQNLTIYNLVVFINHADISHVTVNSRGVIVLKHHKLRRVISDIEQRATTIITQTKLGIIQDQINLANQKSRQALRQHIDRIKVKYGK